MSITVAVDLADVAGPLGLPQERVAKVIELLDAGNTVPFITRYRKDQTGGMDEEQIRAIQARTLQLRQLVERKHTILRSIESQGKLTPALSQAILEADSHKRLEDLYLPYKPKKQTLATAARERGLEPLANEILSADPLAAQLDVRAADFVNTDKITPPEKQVHTAAEALLGAGHILAEEFSERAELRDRLRAAMWQGGFVVATKVDPDSPATEESARFQDYFNFRESNKKVPPHRVLALNRGEKAKILRIKIELDPASYEGLADELLIPPEHPHVEFLRGCVQDALQRLVLPSLEREIRRELTDRAETHAVGVFARNLRHLLLQPPVRGRRVLAIDPGFKSGCKLATIDEFGNLMGHGVIHIVGSAEKRQAGRTQLLEMIAAHEPSVVAIGNGTACRQTEELIAELLANELAGKDIAYVIVNEAGASVYSASQLGREEFPKYDATLRGTISIGRRLQDPLSELVKIDPGSIGVGLYQHDVKAKHLRDSLEQVVESCVNYVGVDVNTASPALMRFVSGLNQLTARRVYDYRVEHGPFKTREELKQVPGLGDAAFTQSAGFLKIVDGDCPLDATWIHPESYAVTERVIERLGTSTEALKQKETLEELSQKTAALDRASIQSELEIGELTLRDILTQLSRPGRDPREDLPPPVFKQGVLKIEDLSVGMELSGSVLNVVDFGAFVDIGLSDSGLVHISHMSQQYVANPHDVVAVGDIVKVWVIGVDKARRRVSLSMVPPQEKPAPPPRRPRPARPAAAQTVDGQGSAPAAGREAQQGNRGGQRGGRRHERPQKPRRPKRPPVLVDLSKNQQDGKEPLRTFNELFSLMELRKREDDEPTEST
jgi:uncharacterized protein